MNPMWKVYKGKVMKTLNPEYDEDSAEQVTDNNDMMPVQEDEGPNAVSQMARKMQGAGAKSWNRFSALFNKEDEHQLLEETETPPVNDHPLAVKPEEDPPRNSRRTGFWDGFATNFAAKKQMDAASAATAASATNEAVEDQADDVMVTEENLEEEPEEEPKAGGRSNSSFSKYVSLGGGSEDASFKWNFVTGKLAELKTKSMTKTN